MPNPINKYNKFNLSSVSSQVKIFQEDLQNIYNQITAVCQSILDREPFVILSGFNSNGSGGFTGGTFSVSGLIYTIPTTTTILSGSYLRPTETQINQRTTSNGTEYFQYTEYVAIVDNTYTVLPPITQENINNYRFNCFLGNAIVNNLTTNDPKKILSAQQGVVLNSIRADLNTRQFKFNPYSPLYGSGTWRTTNDGGGGVQNTIGQTIESVGFNFTAPYTIGMVNASAGSPYPSSGKTILNLCFNGYSGHHQDSSTVLSGKNYAFVVGGFYGDGDHLVLDQFLQKLNDGNYENVRYSLDGVGNIFSTGTSIKYPNGIFTGLGIIAGTSGVISTGNITTTNGDVNGVSINAGNGGISSNGGAVISTGDLGVTAGNINLLFGGVNLTQGSVVATNGNIKATNGYIQTSGQGSNYIGGIDNGSNEGPDICIGKGAYTVFKSGGSIAIGTNATTGRAYRSVAIGYDASAGDNTMAVSNLAIGDLSLILDGFTQSSAIGHGAIADENSLIQLGGGTLGTLRSPRHLSVVSDRRDKTNIEPSNYELNKSIFESLEVVNYNNNFRELYYEPELSKEIKEKKEEYLNEINFLKEKLELEKTKE